MNSCIFLADPHTGGLVERNTNPTWSNRKSVAIGDPVSLEYMRVSLKLDHPSNKPFTQSRVSFKRDLLLSSFVSSIVSTKRALETVVYYDQNYEAGITSVAIDDEYTPQYAKDRNLWTKYQKIYTSGPFDASEYAHSVCYYTPGYEGSTITLTTKFFEIRKTLTDFVEETVSIAKSTITTLSGAVSAANPVLGIATPLLNSCIGAGGSIITELIDEKHLLFPTHTIDFRFNDSTAEALYTGAYIVLLNEAHQEIPRAAIDELIENVVLQSNRLIDNRTRNEYTQYSYFIIQLQTMQRDELRDFDFTASCADQLLPIANLISMEDSNNQKLTQQIVAVKSDSYDLLLIESIEEALSKQNKDMAKALFAQLQANNPVRAQWLLNHCAFAFTLKSQ